MAKHRQYQWDISRSVVIASIFFFLYAGGKACLLPFITLYFKHLGLTATQTGLLFATKHFVWYLAAPIWLVFAKRFVYLVSLKK